MICLKCHKQIPDDSLSCPNCGSQVNAQTQIPKEISFRRYQRWAFYIVLSLVVIALIAVIVRMSQENSKLVTNLTTTQVALIETKENLQASEVDLSSKVAEVSSLERTLSQKDIEMQSKTNEFKLSMDELNKKLAEAASDITLTEEERKKCNLNLNTADANIYNLIIKLGEGLSNDDLRRIPLADVNLEGPDEDGDGLSDIIEYAIGTDKANADTDGDGYSDKSEVLSGYDPLRADEKMPIDEEFANTKKGMILLQVEQNNEAWYVSEDGYRYFLGNPADAFQVMRSQSYWTGDYMSAGDTEEKATSTMSLIGS